MAYVKALFCNVCGVVFWKGVEEVISAANTRITTAVCTWVDYSRIDLKKFRAAKYRRRAIEG